VVANRVKRNTLIYQSLMRFLETLRIPVIATLRDSQNYVRAAELGLGLHEMKRYLVEQDLADWEPMLAWLKAKEGVWRPSAGIPCPNPLETRDRLEDLLFVVPGAADLLGPVLVAVPAVEVVGDRSVPAAGLVEVSRDGADATPGSARGAGGPRRCTEMDFNFAHRFASVDGHDSKCRAPT
jgi:hypothetical protein